MSEQKENVGFKSREEVAKYCSDFYNELCKTLSSTDEVTEESDFVKKYIDDKLTIIQNGSITSTNSAKNWLPYHNNFVKLCKKVTVDTKIESWTANSFVVSYVYNCIFFNDKALLIRGMTSIVVGKDKKILYLIETAYNDSAQKVGEFIQSLQNK